MTKPKLSKGFLDMARAVKKPKRAKIVIDHILRHGYITSDDLASTYGYKHPPRAVRDVREQGIPIETFRVKSDDGRTIAAYRFGDPTKVRRGKLSGRQTYSKAFKHRLVNEQACRCAICLESYENRYLQIDHRVPYEVEGEAVEGEGDTRQFMLLCGSCNRAKSWSCEHCVNWTEKKIAHVCRLCYWANPESFQHIALQDIRRLEIVWSREEVRTYDRLQAIAKTAKVPMPKYVKRVLQRYLERK